MTWWGWLIIILLTISALGFSAWYLLSVGRYWESKKFTNWNHFLTRRQPLTETDMAALQNIPVALLMVVGVCDGLNQEWQPLYLMPSTNVQTTVAKWNREITINYRTQTSHPISDYLFQTKQTPATIKYYLFHRYRNEFLLNRDFSKLIIKSRLKQIGFNQFFENSVKV